MSRDRGRNDSQKKGAAKPAKSPLKLKLNKETLRMLNSDELALIAGGLAPHTCANEETPC